MRHVSKTARKAMVAAAMSNLREAWKDADFYPVSTMAHAKDKQKITAYANLTRFERLLELVKDQHDDYAIELAATRNTPRLPTYDMVDTVKEKLEQDTLSEGIKNQVKALLGSVNTYSKKYRIHKAAADEDKLNDDMKALSVIYANMAVAAFKLAEALANDV